VADTDELMLITSGGILVRTRANEVSILGRNTQGVRMIKLDKGEKLVGIDRIVKIDGEDEEQGEESSEPATEE
jgi:DNA gyrase subunit A